MCELTFSHLGNDLLNKTYIYLQLNENSTSNKNGFGVFVNRNKVIKSKETFFEIDNPQVLFTDLLNNEPILGHTRIATSSLNGKVEIAEKNSHPFEYKNLVLAHNGILTLRNTEEAKKPEYIDKIDSDVFASKLNDMMETKDSFINCFNKTMDLFTGRYSMLIYNKLDNHYYIAKGDCPLWLAKLYVNNKFIGIVVNTDKIDLSWSLKLLTGMYKVSNNIVITYKIEDITEKTLYRVDEKKKELKIVGTIHVNGYIIVDYTKPVVKTPLEKYLQHNIYGDKYDDPNLTYYNRGVADYSKSDEERTNKLYPYIAEFCEKIKEMDLSFYETVILMHLYNNKSLPECTKEDYESFIDGVLNKLQVQNTKAKMRVWDDLKKYHSPQQLYLQLDNFPYMLNSKGELKNALYNITKKMKKTHNNKSIQVTL